MVIQPFWRSYLFPLVMRRRLTTFWWYASFLMFFPMIYLVFLLIVKSSSVLILYQGLLLLLGPPIVLHLPRCRSCLVSYRNFWTRVSSGQVLPLGEPRFYLSRRRMGVSDCA